MQGTSTKANAQLASHGAQKGALFSVILGDCIHQCTWEDMFCSVCFPAGGMLIKAFQMSSSSVSAAVSTADPRWPKLKIVDAYDSLACHINLKDSKQLYPLQKPFRVLTFKCPFAVHGGE